MNEIEPTENADEPVATVSPPMIELQRLCRYFGETRAVQDVSFQVRRGEVFGFIGPNGAGKTTSMRILAGLDTPSSGDARVDGFSVVDDPDRARLRLGFMPDYFDTDHAIDCRDYLDFFARAYGLRGVVRRRALHRVMRFTGLDAIQHKPISGLSKGMKQRLCLGRALIHDPPVLILDEPAAGLDPRARIELREIVRALSRQGKAILISSHILTELAEICDRVGIIEQGELIAEGSVAEMRSKLMNRAGPSEHQVRVLGSPEGLVQWLNARTDVRRRVEHARHHQIPAAWQASRIGRPASRDGSGGVANSRIRASRDQSRGCFPGRHSRESPMTHDASSGAVSPADAPTQAPPPLSHSQRLATIASSQWFRRLDHLLEHWSEHLSPILVKEARQALKSRRFLFTFFALILAGWIWSLFGVGVQAGSSTREATGQFLLAGYVVILALPLTIVIPFSAFYSLSRECQNGSFELTSLTRMSALHIVLGKLGSVLLQIGVYFSALVPFIALAYLLRGVDLTTIFFFLAMNLLISLSLSCLAILLASTATNTLSALSGTVITAAGCVIAGLVWAFPMQLELLDMRPPLNSGSFWSVVFAGFGLTLAAANVVIMAAAAALDFPSKNRSTPVRWAILALLAALTAWTITAWIATNAEEYFVTGLLMAAFAFTLIGAVVNCENPDLSLRAQRSCPRPRWGECG